MVSRVSVSNNPKQTISPIFSAPHLIDILKMKHHANPEHYHLPRRKFSQVNTTSFKTVGSDIDSCYRLKYKLIVIIVVSVIRRIFREQVVKFLSSMMTMYESRSAYARVYVTQHVLEMENDQMHQLKWLVSNLGYQHQHRNIFQFERRTVCVR